MLKIPGVGYVDLTQIAALLANPEDSGWTLVLKTGDQFRLDYAGYSAVAKELDDLQAFIDSLDRPVGKPEYFPTEL